MAKQLSRNHRLVGKPAPHDTAHLEILFASIGEGVIATNAQGLITRVNQIALDLFGYRKSQMMGKRFIDVVIAVHDNGSIVDPLERSIIKVFMTGQAISERALYRRRGGSVLPVIVTVSPILSHGKPIGAVEVFRDLTAEIEADKLKSDFISIASHQLRTPLSAINMYTRMLQDGMAGKLSGAQREYTNIVLGSVERMNELIDTLLNITRIEAGGLMVNPAQVDLGDLARGLITESQPAADKKRITLNSAIVADLPAILSDTLLLREVCSNLLSNAIKYTPDGGKVTLALMQKNKDICCTVTDTGYGIPAAQQKHIFTKFFRAENISRQDVSGTGLGLYLTKALVERLGGEIWFESKENVGTTFSFTLPISSEL